MTFRITYSVLDADLTQLHKEFDAALAKTRSHLGQEYPSLAAHKEIRSSRFIDDKNPARPSQILARFHVASSEDANEAFVSAKSAAKQWARTSWQKRVEILRKAADLISARRMEFAAIMSLEAGKNRLESLGDVEEAADLFRYYAAQLEEAKGFDRPLGSLSPNEKTRSILKPYGVFVVIAPFNFPMALSAGMSAGALLGGNCVILKPSQEAPWSGHVLFDVLKQAGLPDGVFQVLHGTGPELASYLAKHALCDGVVFTGSKAVGLELYRGAANQYVKPCFLELGGKNACLVSDKADIEKAAQGCVRSAFGLTGQKCSALSRVFVHEAVKDRFIEAFISQAKALKLGDPTLQDTFVGPLINQKSLDRFEAALIEAKRDGKVLLGGESLKSRKELEGGYYAQPTFVEIASSHRLSREELFAPLLTLATYRNWDDAISVINSVEYGLTGGVFSQDPSEVERFMDEAEAGVLYANRATGATTGAWPGVQAFCGWKGSGSTGKGGCGPYYVSQFMREQSQTRMLTSPDVAKR